MAGISNERLENWLQVKKKYIEAAKTGKGSKLIKGQIVRTPDDFKLVRAGVYNDKFPAREATEVVSQAGDLGAVLSNIILTYPNALKRKTRGQTSVHRIYGEPGVGKSESTRLVLENLLKLHMIADAAARGQMKREEAIKTISKVASHVFAPYTQAIEDENNKVNWEKWADDLIDAAGEYGNWKGASYMANMEQAMNANEYARIYTLNRAYTESLPEDQRRIIIRNAIKSLAPVAQADDFLVNTDTESSLHNVTDIIDMAGEKVMPSAVLVDTENAQGQVVDMTNKAYNSTDGRRDRSGIGHVVSAKSGQPIVSASMETAYQMADDLYASVMLNTLHDALFGENAGEKRLAQEALKSKLQARGEIRNPAHLLDQIKQSLLDIAGGDEGKASDLLKAAGEILSNFIATKSAGEYKLALQEFGTNNLLDPVLHQLADAVGKFKDNKDAATKMKSLLSSLSVLLEKSGHDFKNDMRGQAGEDVTPEKMKNKKGSALLEGLTSNETFNKSFQEKAEGVDKEQLQKKAEELEKKKEKANAEDNKKAEENAKEVKQAFSEEAKQFGEGTVKEQMMKEADWDSLASSPEKKTQSDVLFNFARVFQNSKLCRLVGPNEKLAEEKEANSIEAGRLSDGSRVLVDERELKNSRTFAMWQDAVQAAREYLGEEAGNTFIRDLILSAHGPSLAAHVLMKSLGVYEGAEGAKGELPFFERFGKLTESGLDDFKKEYSEEDLKKAVDLLHDLAGTGELKKLSTGADAIDNELHKQMNSLLNEDGTVNESVNKSLRGFEVLADMLSKHSDKIIDMINPEHMRDVGSFIGAMKQFAEADKEKFDFENLTKKAEEAEKKRKDGICNDNINLANDAKSVERGALSSNVGNGVKKLVNERAKRLLGLAA